jgi:hypothetical protein
VVTLLALVVAADVLVTTLWLRPAVFDNGLVLAAGVIAYLGAFAFAGWRPGAWKKPLAAILFTAGTFLIAWTSAGRPASELFWPAMAFCALCLGNLLTIERRYRQPASQSFYSQYGWICLMLLGACVIGARDSTWFAAITISAAGLAALVRWGRRISGDVCCVLADAVLLTPLLFR